MGRHDLRRWYPVIRVAALVAVLAVLVAAAWANWPRDDAPPSAAGTTSAPEQPTPEEPARCAETTEIRVTTTPDLAPVLEEVADRLAATPPACADYALTEAPPAVTATQLAVTDAGGPHVWIPDSRVWVDRASSGRAEPLDPGAVLATSPVVVALPGTAAAELAGTQPWQTILTGGVNLRMADPEESTAAMLALLAAGQSLGATPEGEQALGRAMISLSRQQIPADELFAQADDDGAVAFPASEQQVFRYLAEHPDASLVAVVPTEGSGAFDYPFVTVPQAGSADEDAAAHGVAALEAALTGPEGRAALAAAGFRGPDGTGAPGVPGVPSDLPAPGPVPEPAVVEATLASWRTVAVDMRMLAVIDVSGSMLDDAGGRTRIELAAGAARVAMEQFPPTSQVGLWIFSTEHEGARDWTELVPVGRLDAPAGTGTQRDALVAAADSLPARADGDTGLYDTVLAAYRTVLDGYQPGYVNSVVLLTDGKNEDDDGITLDQLLAELQAAADPDRPVPVITVGMGPGTDESALRVISAQTGGRSYLAADPADIGTVFVDALLNRPRR